MSLPKIIELPEAEDFCHGHIDGPNGTHCFIGWRCELFPDLSFEEEKKFEREAVRVAKRMKLRIPPWLSGSVKLENCLHYINDYDNEPRRLATWFRNTVKAMGYDIT